MKATQLVAMTGMTRRQGSLRTLVEGPLPPHAADSLPEVCD